MAYPTRRSSLTRLSCTALFTPPRGGGLDGRGGGLWEPAENISDNLLEEYEAELEAEAQLETEESAELEGDEEEDE